MLNTNEKIIKHKPGLLNLAEELSNVSRACKVMGFSRDTLLPLQNRRGRRRRRQPVRPLSPQTQHEEPHE